MAFTTAVKKGINRLLNKAGLRLETLSAECIERKRVDGLACDGYFAQPVFRLLPAFNSNAYEEVLSELPKYRSRFESFANPGTNDVGYTFDNGFFTSPDAEVLYTMIRKFAPRRILEIGCGNSTRISRQAIIDGKLPTRLVCVDPHPRTEIRPFADEVHQERVESLKALDLFSTLSPGDFLFIDSSHELRAGNDCVFLYLRALREVKPGVIFHIHDVFLPYDYPAEDSNTHSWAEQYLVQCLLADRHDVEMIWASYYLSRTLRGFAGHFAGRRIHTAPTSFWFRQRV